MTNPEPQPPRAAPLAAMRLRRWPVALLWASTCLGTAVVAAVLWASLWQRHAWHQQVWQAHSQQQQAVADSWGRALTLRLEAQQLAAQALAHSVAVSPEPPLAAAQNWMSPEDGGWLRWFDGVFVVPQGGAAQALHQTPGSAALSAQALQTVHATLADGQPRLDTQVQPDAGVQVLLTVPVHSRQGQVRSALAARVHWPAAWLLPPPGSEAGGFVFQLLQRSGAVLAQSGAHTAVQGQALQVLATHGQEWRQWLRESTGAAPVQHWGRWMLARTALPQVQWEAVVVAAVPWHAAMPWPALVLGALLLWAAAALALVWGWRRWAPRAQSAQLGGPEAAAPPQAWLAAAGAPGSLALYGRALLDMAPVPLLAVQGETVRLCNAHVQLLLGYSAAELEGQHVSVLFGDVLALLHAERQVRDQIHHMGRYSGVLQLRRRDGSLLAVQLQAQWLPTPAGYTVWRLRPPAAQWRRDVWPRPEVVPVHEVCDVLTGLPNRTALGWQLQAWMAQAVPQAGAPSTGRAWAQLPTRGCVLVLDVDHLGALNEVASRSFGDSVLHYIAQLLHAQLRNMGWVVRLGGDEFVAVLPGVSLAHAQTVGQRLCDALQQWRPLWREEAYSVSISVGVVAVDVLRHDMQQALRAADLACYEAKRRGRGQVAAGQVCHAEVPQRAPAPAPGPACARTGV